MSDEITVRIPATSANIGPGYDCLGVALRLYNTIRVRRTTEETAQSPMILDAADAYFEAAQVPPFPFSCTIEGDVPRSRGLGSSVTVRLGVLCGLGKLCASPLTVEQLFAVCARLEGHPDNAAPAAFGGFTVAASGALPLRFEVDPRLQFVLLVPDFEVATPEARKVLPAQIPHRDATRNSANASRITAAFASQQYEQLGNAFEDFLHQPFRAPLIPFLFDVIAAGKDSGALGGYLSGSGSTICCLTTHHQEKVAAAMLAVSGQPNARTIITTADNKGARVL
jgi:homoserine kinase